MNCKRTSKAGRGGTPCGAPAVRSGLCSYHYERRKGQLETTRDRWLSNTRLDPLAWEAWKRKQRKRSLANYYANRVAVLMYGQLLLLAFPELRAKKKQYDRRYRRRVRAEGIQGDGIEMPRVDVADVEAAREAAAEALRRKEMAESARDLEEQRRRLAAVDEIGRAEVLAFTPRVRRRRARRWTGLWKSSRDGVAHDVDDLVEDDLEVSEA